MTRSEFSEVYWASCLNNVRFLLPNIAVNCCEIFLHAIHSYPAFGSHVNINVIMGVEIKSIAKQKYSPGNF